MSLVVLEDEGQVHNTWKEALGAAERRGWALVQREDREKKISPFTGSTECAVD